MFLLISIKTLPYIAIFIAVTWSVYGLIRNYNPHSFLYFEKVNKIITLINGDITDFHLMKRIIAEEGIQHVFHLAAQVEVGTALEYPYLTWESNIRGTYTLLEAIREVKTDIKSIFLPLACNINKLSNLRYRKLSERNTI